MPYKRLIVAVTLVAAVACGNGAEEVGTGEGTTTTTTTTRVADTTTTTEAAPAQDCSAAGLSADLEAQPALPPAVAATRERIAEAAVACDYAALERLAQGGADAFTYSFGDSGDPAGFWQRQEESGADPLRFMVEVLRRPFGTIEHHGPTMYAWPSAFVYDSWSEVPAEDREALKPLYDEDDFEGFERFGGYVGYRVVITQDGTWTAFVAGD